MYLSLYLPHSFVGLNKFPNIEEVLLNVDHLIPFNLCSGVISYSKSFKLAPVGFFPHRCNGCSQNPIVGLRFKCKTCTDFNYCETCFRSKRSHRHTFMRISEPGQWIANILIIHITFCISGKTICIENIGKTYTCKCQNVIHPKRSTNRLQMSEILTKIFSQSFT